MSGALVESLIDRLSIGKFYEAAKTFPNANFLVLAPGEDNSGLTITEAAVCDSSKNREIFDALRLMVSPGVAGVEHIEATSGLSSSLLNSLLEKLDTPEKQQVLKKWTQVSIANRNAIWGSVFHVRGHLKKVADSANNAQKSALLPSLIEALSAFDQQIKSMEASIEGNHALIHDLKANITSSLLSTLDFSAPRDKAIFWTGYVNKNQATAMLCATHEEKLTLEGTAGGSLLDSLQLYSLGSSVSNDLANLLFDIASERFARAALGEVTAVIVEKPNPASVYARIERPILQAKESEGLIKLEEQIVPEKIARVFWKHIDEQAASLEALKGAEIQRIQQLQEQHKKAQEEAADIKDKNQAQCTKNIGECYSLAAKKLQKAVDLETGGNPVVAKSWRELSNVLLNQRVEYFTKASLAYASQKIDEGQQWKNAGICTGHFVDMLTSALDSESSGNTAASEQYHHAANLQQRAIDMFVKSAASYAANSTVEAQYLREAGFGIQWAGYFLSTAASEELAGKKIVSSIWREASSLYQLSADFYRQALEARNTKENQKEAALANAGDCCFTAGCETKEAATAEGNNNSALSQRWNEKANEMKKAVDLFQKVVSSDVEADTKRWESAALSCKEAARCSREVLLAELNSQEEQAEGWREKMEFYQKADHAFQSAVGLSSTEKSSKEEYLQNLWDQMGKRSRVTADGMTVPKDESLANLLDLRTRSCQYSLEAVNSAASGNDEDEGKYLDTIALTLWKAADSIALSFNKKNSKHQKLYEEISSLSSRAAEDFIKGGHCLTFTEDNQKRCWNKAGHTLVNAADVLKELISDYLGSSDIKAIREKAQLLQTATDFFEKSAIAYSEQKAWEGKNLCHAGQATSGMAMFTKSGYISEDERKIIPIYQTSAEYFHKSANAKEQSLEGNLWQRAANNLYMAAEKTYFPNKRTNNHSKLEDKAARCHEKGAECFAQAATLASEGKDPEAIQSWCLAAQVHLSTAEYLNFNSSISDKEGYRLDHDGDQVQVLVPQVSGYFQKAAIAFLAEKPEEGKIWKLAGQTCQQGIETIARLLRTGHRVDMSSLQADLKKMDSFYERSVKALKKGRSQDHGWKSAGEFITIWKDSLANVSRCAENEFNGMYGFVKPGRETSLVVNFVNYYHGYKLPVSWETVRACHMKVSTLALNAMEAFIKKDEVKAKFYESAIASTQLSAKILEQATEIYVRLALARLVAVPLGKKAVERYLHAVQIYDQASESFVKGDTVLANSCNKIARVAVTAADHLKLAFEWSAKSPLLSAETMSLDTLSLQSLYEQIIHVHETAAELYSEAVDIYCHSKKKREIGEEKERVAKIIESKIEQLKAEIEAFQE